MPDDRYFEPAVETMPRADLETGQEEALLDLLPYVYEHSGLIRAVWESAGVKPADIRSLADYQERAPFIDKGMIRQYRDRRGDPFGGLLCADPADVTTIVTSSGTTGDATFFVDRHEPWAPLYLGMVRAWWGMGVRPGDVVLMSPPGTFRGPSYHAAQACGAVPLAVNCWVGNWPQAFELIRRHRPVYMAFSSPQLTDLARFADDHDIREIFSCFKAVSFAGEPLGPRMSRRMTEEWGMNLYIWTSVGDAGLAFECDQHDGCHTWQDNVLVEHLHPSSGDEMADGDIGELVVTSLDDRVAPLIRYRSDDLIRFTRSACGCGRTHARVWMLGRKGDQVVVQGRSILPIDVWGAIEEASETAAAVFQIIRTSSEMDDLRLRVGFDPAITGDVAELSGRVSDTVEAAVGIRPALELVPQDEILSKSSVTKYPRVTQT